MPVLFDDLVPQEGAPQAAAPGGMFDDLLPPKIETQTQQAAPMTGTVPVQENTFFDKLSKLGSAYYTGLKNTLAFPHDVMTGQTAVPQSANFPGGENTQNIGQTFNLAQMALPLSPVGTGRPMMAAKFEAPSEAELETAARGPGQGYNNPAVTELQLKPEAGTDLANIIRADLKSAKLDKFNGQNYFDIADRLENPRFGDNLTIDDLEAARQDAAAPPATATPADKRGGKVIKDAIDNYFGNIPESHVLSGDAGAANTALTNARSDFAAMKRSQDVTAALGRAEHQAGSTYSGQGLENATRQQLRPILNQKTGVAKRAGFEDYTPDEIDALKTAVNGSVLRNTVRDVNNLLSKGHGTGATVLGGLGFAGGHAFGLDPYTSMALGAGTMGLGRGLNTIANRMTANEAGNIGALLRSRSAMANNIRNNPNMVPALWPQLIRSGALTMPILGMNTQAPQQ